MIADADRRADKPVLAICVGHQVLFESGIEHGVEPAGLRRLARGRGAAGRRPAAAHGLEHRAAGPSERRLFAGVEAERFYFVHSYGVRRAGRRRPTGWITWAEHGGDRFVAAVEEGPLWSTQFHPEKSGDAGARLIANWVAATVSPH